MDQSMPMNPGHRMSDKSPNSPAAAVAHIPLSSQSGFAILPASSHHNASHLEPWVVPAGPAPNPDGASLLDHHASVVAVIAPIKDMQRALVALEFLRGVHGVSDPEIRALAEPGVWSAGLDDLEPFALATGRLVHRNPTHCRFWAVLFDDESIWVDWQAILWRQKKTVAKMGLAKCVEFEAVLRGKGAKLQASSTRATYLVPAKAYNPLRHSMPLFIPSGISSRFVTWTLAQRSVIHSQKWASDKPLPASPSNLGCSSPVRKDTTVGDSCGCYSS